MIRSFANRETSNLEREGSVAGISAKVVRRARRILDKMHAATRLQDLMAPPGHRLAKVKRSKPTRYRIHVLGGYWLSFCWSEPFCDDVKLE